MSVAPWVVLVPVRLVARLPLLVAVPNSRNSRPCFCSDPPPEEEPLVNAHRGLFALRFELISQWS